MNVFVDTDLLLDVLARRQQFFSALRADADCLVSRNAGHFPTSDLPVLSPTEFLAAHAFE